MSICRRELVTRHNPKLSAVDIQSPLSVGNGDFVYTADVTGMQSLVSEYLPTVPLCTMAHWGWHTLPADHPRYHTNTPGTAPAAGVRQGGTPVTTGSSAGLKASLAGRTSYTLSDLTQTSYPYRNRTVQYPVDCVAGEEPVYTWLRENPHRANLALIGLCLNGQALSSAEVNNIQQELALFEGVIHSSYTINGTPCHVETVADSTTDTVAFRIKSEALREGLSAFLAFPFASPEKAAGSMAFPSEHRTEILDAVPAADTAPAVLKLRRIQNHDIFYVTICIADGVIVKGELPHTFQIHTNGSGHLSFSVSFSRDTVPEAQDFSSVLSRSKAAKRDFWEKGGAIDFGRCKDPRAKELERRMILSEYLLSIQSAGSLPPPETGLTCNSWYGKFHLEMHPWHAAWLPLWGHGDLLEKSLHWYEAHLSQARENAAKNGFAGARWPKMTAEDAWDSPSVIAPLLIWQQPHLIFLCELLYQAEPDEAKKKEHLLRYFPLLKETADFMADFAVYSPEKDRYELLGPLIPAQECHKPQDVKNPTFELEYWHFGLTTALSWAERIEALFPESPYAPNRPETADAPGASKLPSMSDAEDVKTVLPHNAALRKWSEVCDKLLVPSADQNGFYPAHENCPDTFTRYNEDHPSMLCAYGLLDTGRLDTSIVSATLKKVEECWDYTSLWGWDFAVLAMTALRLGDAEHALSLLLSDTPKNHYVTNGHNNQEGDASLPLYLPGNGSLLLALAVMAGGYPGSGPLPGFPKNGLWDDIEVEGITGLCTRC
ncbi:MAG: hypothetical protein ACI4QX_09955 [Lachnospiraceae bacterium]